MASSGGFRSTSDIVSLQYMCDEPVCHLRFVQRVILDFWHEPGAQVALAGSLQSPASLSDRTRAVKPSHWLRSCWIR